MACKIDLRDLIVNEANSQGVPPEIALAVATQESRLCHWLPNGSVLRGKAGEYGVMQLKPATAADLGVDPTDVNDNIHGGVKYLRQLYDRYGDWQLAVQHYNGSGPRARAYAIAVMAIARGYGFALNAAGNKSNGNGSQPPQAASPPAFLNSAIRGFVTGQRLMIGGAIVAGAFLAWAIASD